MKKILIALALAGCTHEEKPMPKEEIRVEVLSVTPVDPVEGDWVEVSYKIFNGMKDVLVVGPGRSEYGSLERGDLSVKHHTLHQEATPPVFYHRDQVLMRGDSKTMSFRRQAHSTELRTSVSFVRFPEASFEIYVLYLREGMPGHEATYEKMDAVRFGVLRAREKERIGGCIIYPGGEKGEASTHAKVTLKPRAFPLAEAKKKFGADVTDSLWSKDLDGWILASAKRDALVKASGVTELPRGSIVVLEDLDAGGKSFEFRLADPEATALSKAFKTRQGDGMYRHGTFIDVPSENLLAALETVRKELLSVKKVFYFFDSYYFEVGP